MNNSINSHNTRIGTDSYQFKSGIAPQKLNNENIDPKDKIEIGGSSQKEAENINPKQLALPSTPPTPEKELTVLFYMNGQYDDIGSQTADALINIEKAGPDENTNLVAQLGRNPYKPKEDSTSFHIPVDGDWSGVRRYEIRQNSHSDLDVPLSEWEKLEPEMPNNPVLKYVIGEYHWQEGNKDVARKYFDEARALGMNEYIDSPKSDKSKAIREEFDAKSRHLDEALVDKKVFSSEMLQELPADTRMKDPVSIQDFVSWGMQKYPAKHYMLVVMAHGGAWMGASAMSPKSMADGIEKGIAEASMATGQEKKLDALVFNSCYMGSVEAMAEFKNTAEVTLASENYATTGIFDDWAGLMGQLQKDLKEGNSFDNRKFASDTVEKYRADNLEVKENFPDFFPWKRAYLTLSAVDNKKIGALVDSWKNFNTACKENKVTDQQLFKAVKESKDYASSAMVPRQVFAFYDQIRDMGDILDNVNKSETIPAAVKDAAGQAKKALADCLINEQHEGVGMEGSQGLSIWGPANGIDVLFMSNSYNEDVPSFNKETGWSERLTEALKNIPKAVTQEFLKNYNEIKSIKAKMDKEGIEEAEKEKLQKDMEALQDRNVELREQMDFSNEREANLFKNAERKVQVELLGDRFKGEGQQFLQNDTMKRRRPL